MPLLEVKNLDKAFVDDKRTVTAINKLTLSIEEHEFVSIVGPSGCGKSTFLHIIGGFEPATTGELWLNGRPIGPPGPDRGMMFQDLSLFPWLTALERIAAACGVALNLHGVLRATDGCRLWSARRRLLDRHTRAPWRSVRLWQVPSFPAAKRRFRAR